MASLDQGCGTRRRTRGQPSLALALPVSLSWSRGPELRGGLTLLLAVASLMNGPLAAAGPPGRANQPWGLIISWGEGPSIPARSRGRVRFAGLTGRRVIFLHPFLNHIKS